MVRLSRGYVLVTTERDGEREMEEAAAGIRSVSQLVPSWITPLSLSLSLLRSPFLTVSPIPLPCSPLLSSPLLTAWAHLVGLPSL